MRSSSSLAILALATTALGLSGEASFYGGNLSGGTCSFSSYTLPAGIYGTALSGANWDSAAHCGACVEVTGPSGTKITAMIVDQCPDCGTNQLDLFPDAFAQLADPSKGVIDTTWSYVECPITTPLEVKNKDGVSANWFSMQVVNANKEVTALEVSLDGGNTWHETDRQTYNFFEKSDGFGTDSVTVKVTSVDGDIVVVSPCSVSPNEVFKSDINFISEVGPGSEIPAVPSPDPTTPTPTPSSSSTTTTSTSTTAAVEAPTTTSAAPVVEETPSPAPEVVKPTTSSSTTKAATTPAATEKTTTSAPAVINVGTESSNSPAAAPEVATTFAVIPAADINATPSAQLMAHPAVTTSAAEVAATPSPEAESTPSADAGYGASPEAASTSTSASIEAAPIPTESGYDASPEAASTSTSASVEATTTSSSTTTIFKTVTIPRHTATSSKYTPSAKPYPTSRVSGKPNFTKTIYDCGSSTATPPAGAASSTFQIVGSPVPTTASASPSVSILPFTGAASTNVASLALTMVVIAVAALM